MIIARGGDWFRSLGVENSGGTRFCVSGHVVNPGTFELPMGVPMQRLIDLCRVRQNRRQSSYPWWNINACDTRSHCPRGNDGL